VSAALKAPAYRLMASLSADKLPKRLRALRFCCPLREGTCVALGHLLCVSPDCYSYLEAEGMNKTWRFKQGAAVFSCVRSARCLQRTWLEKSMSVLSARCAYSCALTCQATKAAPQMFSLKLDEFGPYSLDYTRNGRYSAKPFCSTPS
jgi:hypothetical protein